ncbi:MAG: hypothetical protein J5I65_17070 [Aridibacter famidurans]|nr:hypothetical protein [Aridibacter famidurans]
MFIDLPPEGGSGKDVWVNRNNNQDLVYLNTNRAWVWHRDNVRQDKYGAIYRLIHEATHLAVRLIQSQQKASPFRTLQFRPDERLWPSDARQLAKNIIKENRLETGIIREWERIHRAFVSAGIAKSYYGGNWKEMVGYSVEYLAKDGFMSAYGGEQANEDIAEMVSWAIIRDKAVKPEDGACKVMNGRSTSSIQRDDSAVFTKLGFIRSLGFISEAQYKSCVGRLEIDAPAEGFHSYRGGNSVYRYTSNPRAGVGRGSGSDEEWLLANITADGSLSTTSESSVPVTVELILNVTPIVDGITDPGKRSDRLAIPVADVSYPRGIYFIGFRYGRLNKLMIRRKDNGKLILDVAQGIALVGRAGKDGIVGSVFVERVANYSGGLLSAIAGDEPVKESTRITFLYKPRTN